MRTQISYEHMHQLEEQCRKLRAETMFAMIASPIASIWKRLCALTSPADRRVLRHEPI